MMKIFIHCVLDHVERTLIKIEWTLKGEFEVEEGKVNFDMPESLFEFVRFLLALGKAEYVVGYDLERKVNFIKNAMNRNDFRLAIKRATDINRIDLHKYIPEMKRPSTVVDVIDAYYLNQETIKWQII